MVYHCNHLGKPQEMSDHTGAIIWKAEYKAWGECKTEKAKSNFFENSEIISNNIRFQGQYFDLETGLHYNRHRYYSDPSQIIRQSFPLSFSSNSAQRLQD